MPSSVAVNHLENILDEVIHTLLHIVIKESTIVLYKDASHKHMHRSYNCTSSLNLAAHKTYPGLLKAPSILGQALNSIM